MAGVAEIRLTLRCLVPVVWDGVDTERGLLVVLGMMLLEVLVLLLVLLLELVLWLLLKVLRLRLRMVVWWVGRDRGCNRTGVGVGVGGVVGEEKSEIRTPGCVCSLFLRHVFFFRPQTKVEQFKEKAQKNRGVPGGYTLFFYAFFFF